MKMLNDWMRIKLLPHEATAQLVGLDGKPVDVSSPTDEDTLFQVLEVGPQVTQVSIGNVVVVSFMSGMLRFKLPKDSFSSFAVRENDVLGIVSKQL